MVTVFACVVSDELRPELFEDTKAQRIAPIWIAQFEIGRAFWQHRERHLRPSEDKSLQSVDEE
jgi:hypothetical protein